MKKAGILVLLLITLGFIAFKSEKQVSLAFMQEGNDGIVQLRKLNNEAFKRGEVLKFRVHYGIMDAGEAVVEVTDEIKTFGSRKAYHVVGIGRSKGTFDWFFKVRDRYESYIDEEAIIPWVFIRRVDEGGFIINQDYTFNHYKKKVDIGSEVFDIPENTQDMISAFYATRCLDFSTAKVGDVFVVNSFVDKEVFPLKIKYAGKEIIKTSFGKIRCLKFNPVIQQGRVFKDEEDLKVWITDDKNHIPIRVQAELFVGSIKMDLTSYSGLANPISKVE